MGQSPVFASFKAYCMESGNEHILKYVQEVNRLFTNSKELLKGLPLKDSVRAIVANGGPIPLGQIAFKEEAAGKLRNFAIVDL